MGIYSGFCVDDGFRCRFWIKNDKKFKLIFKGVNGLVYFNYHAKVKRLILQGELLGYEFLDEYNGISPALVLYFKHSPPMPIRSYRWEEYVPLLEMLNKD